VVLLLARATLQLGQLVVGAVNDVKADSALLHTLKALVDIPLPHQDAVQNGAILMHEQCCHLQHPRVPLSTRHAHSFLAVTATDFTRGAVCCRGRTLLGRMA